MNTPRDWADEKASRIYNAYMAALSLGEPFNIIDEYADAIRVKPGHVRIPDGREVRISELGMDVFKGMADGKPWGDPNPFVSFGMNAAAEAAKGGG